MRLFRHWLRVGLGALLAAVCASTTGAYGDAPKVEVGKPAPAFDLPAVNIAKIFPDAKGKRTIALKDFRGANGKNVVLFFFPKAMTRG